jgi:hypothetical protein
VSKDKTWQVQFKDRILNEICREEIGIHTSLKESEEKLLQRFSHVKRTDRTWVPRRASELSQL